MNRGEPGRRRNAAPGPRQEREQRPQPLDGARRGAGGLRSSPEGCAEPRPRQQLERGSRRGQGVGRVAAAPESTSLGWAGSGGGEEAPAERRGSGNPEGRRPAPVLEAGTEAAPRGLLRGTLRPSTHLPEASTGARLQKGRLAGSGGWSPDS